MSDRFVQMSWVMDMIEAMSPHVVLMKHCEHFVRPASAILRFIMKDKPGKYGLLFQVLINAADLYVKPPMTDPKRKVSTHDLVMIESIYSKHWEKCYR